MYILSQPHIHCTTPRMFSELTNERQQRQPFALQNLMSLCALNFKAKFPMFSRPKKKQFLMFTSCMYPSGLCHPLQFEKRSLETVWFCQ